MRNSPATFDAVECPLDGTTLIDASAGTGKTYTIANLYLRLLLERRLEPGQILVVTFTVAATAELTDRIRRRIRDALVHFRELRGSDPFADELAKRCGEPAEAIRILSRTLMNFDSAAIHTISGFCSRLLRELAYECGVPFDAGTLDDQGTLVREVASDIWRRAIVSESRGFLRWLMTRKAGPDLLEAAMRKAGTMPEVRVLPEVKVLSEAAFVQPDSLYEEFIADFFGAANLWRNCRLEILEILSRADLKKTSYNPDKFETWFDELTLYFEGDPADFQDPPKCIEYFCPARLAGAVKKSGEPPSHPFFDAAGAIIKARGELVMEFERRVSGLCARAAVEGIRELARRKASLGVFYFDDLLLKVRAAAGPDSPLAMRTRERYRAALIDEFQDTDPVQYEIFRNLFGGPGQTLFLIGDPKQSIYGFRGAEIHSYLEASRDAGRSFTLRRNWRSTPRLVEAVNSIFSRRDDPFLLKGIGFEPSTGGRDEGGELTIDGRTVAPFVIWNPVRDASSEKDNRGGMISKDEGRMRASAQTCAGIAELLAASSRGRISIGGRPLGPGDFAVLTRRNEDAVRIREKLLTLGIPGVVFTSGSVFATPEALDLLAVVRAAEEPSNQRRIRAAMATGILGVRAGDIHGAMICGEGMEGWVCLFQEMNRIWSVQGFMGAFGFLAKQRRILAKMMTSGPGERGCTNLLHLSELIHQAEGETCLGMKGVSRWLSAMIADPDSAGAEVHQIRLESEAEAVVITTVHRSKGLEYPIVMAPFSWEVKLPKVPPFIYHDRGRVLDFRPVFDFPPGLSLESREILAENLRLLYVALTRARYACFMVWDRFRDGWASGPAYLLHQGENAHASDKAELFQAGFEGLSKEEFMSALENLSAASSGTIEVSIPPAWPNELPLAGLNDDPRPFKTSFRTAGRKLYRTISLVSFSSLVTAYENRHRAWTEAVTETADPDKAGLSGPAGQGNNSDPGVASGGINCGIPGAVDAGLADFPGGAAAGTLLHAVLEKTDFTTLDKDNPAYVEFVRMKLLEHGFDSGLAPGVVSMARQISRTPLVFCPGEPMAAHSGTLRGPEIRKFMILADIPMKDRLDELEFNFPVERLDGNSLSRVFAEHSRGPWSSAIPDYISRDGLIRSRGYMKGFVDMVIRSCGVHFILDWKSNRLDDYSPGGLSDVMASEGYLLQYHIYTLALHLYLRNRVPGYDYDLHFGGVFYVFLRGLGNPDGAGVFHDRPTRRMVEALETIFTGPGSGRSA